MLKLAIIDDDATIRKLLEKIVSRSFPEYQIDVYSNPFDLLECCADYKAILTDNNMPIMNGVEL